ncbi:type IV toxin-antitoxin system AbiEi family antitoxin domain-containing protein [Gordonia sp. (in: high G+C Gram-positive bacteria)]|uniref:type IV toxin-antitoxin system AbiEi family antitoxin domain-containing protein n=1 Tax=Gordonia sp. (in: high G+C Gram-positive bacteria) TaxID=84139 RepID=UPI00333ED3C3
MTIALLLPQDRFGLVRRAAALEAGWTDAMLSAAVRRGELIRVAIGVYAIAGVDLDGPEGADRLYRLRSIATVSNARDGGATVLSHQSAAAVHGLPLLKPNRENIHVTSLTRGGGLIRGGRNVHGGHLDETQIVDVDGIRVTDVVRTAVDVAEAGSFAQALTVFDAALRAGADRASLESELGRRRTKGAREARTAIVVADGRSASVGESWSRAQMIEDGLALPDLQVEHAVDGDTFVVDYEWHGRLMAEYDGLHKYGRLLRPGETTARAVIREKRREDRLRRATGLVMVRWVWADLERHRVAAILREWLD